MDLDDLIITWCCLIDDGVQAVLAGRRMRQRGPQPRLSDSEVLTMEVIGEYLGIQHDTGILRYFQAHHTPIFRGCATCIAPRLPATRRISTGWPSRSGAGFVTTSPTMRILASSLAICQFTRAPRCQRFRGEAASGQDHLTRQRVYGFRFPMRVCWPGVMCQFEVTPGNGSELVAAQDMSAGTPGVLLGFWSPRLHADLAEHNIELLAPFGHRKTDPWPQRRYLVSRWRYWIDTIFGQLVDRTHLKRVWARAVASVPSAASQSPDAYRCRLDDVAIRGASIAL
jgi:hypothetical protein